MSRTFRRSSAVQSVRNAAHNLLLCRRAICVQCSAQPAAQCSPQVVQSDAMESAPNHAFSESPLAAMPQLREKPRLGFSSKNPALHQVHEVCNSTTALGFRAALHLERIRSRYTGKERDTESGLEYFGARYLSSNIARFTSPDPKLMSVRHVLSPQKWNKYAYVQNNPMLSIDPNGMDDYVVFRTVTTGYEPQVWAAVKAQVESTKDSQGRQNTFHMVEGGKATVAAFNKALATPDAHVTFIGHTLDVNNATSGLVLYDGISTGRQGGSITKSPLGTNPTAVDLTGATAVAPSSISANSVSLYGCNTFDLAPSESPYFAGASFLGVEGEIDLNTGDRAAADGITVSTSTGPSAGETAADAGNGDILLSNDEGDTGTNIEYDQAPPQNNPQN
jgi:RHS repeat-associated protein